MCVGNHTAGTELARPALHVTNRTALYPAAACAFTDRHKAEINRTVYGQPIGGEDSDHAIAEAAEPAPMVRGRRIIIGHALMVQTRPHLEIVCVLAPPPAHGSG